MSFHYLLLLILPVLCAIGIAFVFFKVGFMYGHQAGFKAGLTRGLLFSRLKNIEQGDFNGQSRN